MEYKIIVQGRKDYYEATSYNARKTEFDSWIKLKKPKEDTLERVVLDSALCIARERGKKRTKVIIRLG